MTKSDGSEAVTSLSEARASGSKFYFTGTPCRNGHVAPRYTSGRSCTECVNGRTMERYHDDPEKFHERARRWDSENRDRVRILTRDRIRRYREEDPERFREYGRQFRRARPEIHRTNNRNRKARIRGAGGKHTADDILYLLINQNYKCVYCGECLEQREKRHVDHIMPVSRGGTNDKSNLQILCVACNLRKAAKDPLDFEEELGAHRGGGVSE